MKFKMITLLGLVLTSTMAIANSSFERELENFHFSQENIDHVGLTRATKDFYKTLKQYKETSTYYSVADIDLAFGALGVGAGGGKAYVTVDAKNNFKELSIDVTAGMLGINERIKQSISIASLKAGTPLEFSMTGTSKTSLRITPAKGFNENGGKATIEFLRSGGTYSKEYVELARGSKSNKFDFWKNNKQVSSIWVKMRGYSIEGMYVGDYKIE